MYKYLKFYILPLAFLIHSINANAIKATPEPIKLIQPDGTGLTIKLNGDEFFHYTTTEDGYLIQKDDKGVYKYAKFENNTFKLTTQKANNVSLRNFNEKNFVSKLDKSLNFRTIQSIRKIKKSKSLTNIQNSFPVTGSPRSLVILVNFTDKKFATPNAKTAFTNLLNQNAYAENGGTGSARDYFIESSFNQFSPNFDVVGPYDLPNNLSFYGENNLSGDDKNPQQLIIDACDIADKNGLNFSNYDLDNNGIVDNIFVYYAGNNEAEGADANTVWPHRWSLGDYSTKFDGKSIFDYACTSELRGSSGTNMCGIGTFCHEFGHVLGLVDYYHTSNDNKKTLENWSIMDGGAYNNSGRTPPTYSAFDRFFLNWLHPVELKNSQNVTLKPLINNNSAYLISENGNHNLNGSNPNSNEFFLIENRYHTGFDSYLPGEGILIWHIDYNASDWDNNSPNNYSETFQTEFSHMGVYLQPLTGNATTPGNAFTSGEFIPQLWNGKNINKPISEIQKFNLDYKFKFKGGNFDMLPPVALQASDITNKSFVANWTAAEEATTFFTTVYSSIEGTSSETQGFDNGLNVLDWNISATAITNSKNFSGKTIPAIQFQNKNDSIQTEVYPHAVTNLSFYIKSIGSESGIIQLKAKNESGWKVIDEIALSSNYSTIKNYNFNSSNNYTQFIIKYKQVHMNVAIDDITVTYPVNIEYKCKNKIISQNSDTIRNLVSGRRYFYKVKAGDIYDNVTGYSNLIELELLPYPDTKILRIERIPNSTEIVVFNDNAIDYIKVYNTVGQLIASIKPTDLKMEISKYLTKHNLYIITAGNKLNKIIY